MIIQVLGPGCPNCEKLEARVRSLTHRLGIPCTVEHVREIEALLQRGIAAAPALLIDGEVVVAGRVPDEAELTAWLTASRP